MKAVITADIINSSRADSTVWSKSLKNYLQTLGKQGTMWEIYRGDELQILLDDGEEAFSVVVNIRSILLKEKLDARLSIGFGEVNFEAKNVKESNGSAFIYSGRNLEEMKHQKTQNISLKSNFKDFDENFNLIFKLLETSFEKWTPNSANAVKAYLDHPDLNQYETAEKIGISQGAFSRALKRANLDAVLETDRYFRKKIALL